MKPKILDIFTRLGVWGPPRTLEAVGVMVHSPATVAFRDKKNYFGILWQKKVGEVGVF